MNTRKLIYTITHWESWHHHAKYIPLFPVWLWYCIRARSCWFFTATDPSLTFGGFEGEGKEEMYAQLPEAYYPETIYIEPHLPVAELKLLIETSNFDFPFVVKPDVGMMGFMFRKISNFQQLEMYHSKMPVKYLVQKLIDYPHEYGLFYYRLPNETRGTISGLLTKKPPEITGDGRSLFSDLIQKNPDVKLKLEEMRTKHKERLDMILPEGEKYLLSHASNRSQGGKIVNLTHEIDEQLTRVFDEISLHTKHFYYGRYDIKCSSIEDLKQGKNFSILEFNGTGAGVQHVYGNNLSLATACYIILKHWKKMFQIAMINHKDGVAYWKFNTGRKFLKEAKKNLQILKKLDAEFPDF